MLKKEPKASGNQKLLKSEGNEEDSIPIRNETKWKEGSIVNDCEVTIQNPSKDEYLESPNEQVGAFAIAGIGRGVSEVEERSLEDGIMLTAQRSSTKIIARVVDDAFVNAVPVENSDYKLKRMCMIMTIVSLLLLAGIIATIIIFTRRSPSETNLNPEADIESDDEADVFLKKLKPLLSDKSLQDLEFPETATSMALDWIVKSLNVTTYSFDRQVQRFAMAAFFFSTNGSSWKRVWGWLLEDDECTWYQITDERRCVNGTLQVLSLQGNHLNGPLPNEIGLLSSLQVLQLSSNKIKGPIAKVVALNKLKILDISLNDLSGSIPSEIGQCTDLTFLDLSYNSFSRSIPSEIGQCTDLTFLDLSYNSFSRSIPSEIGQCKKLKHLNLYRNPHGGSIPSEIGQCTDLLLLGLSYTFLSGSIPSEIGQARKIMELNLDNNNLFGSIPSESEIGALTKLQHLYLNKNSLYGTIPETICNDNRVDVKHDESVTC
jgi:Leucine-rich repeat (LRR) protein